MYEGAPYRIQDRRRTKRRAAYRRKGNTCKTGWKMACIGLVFIMAGGISFLVAGKVLAAQTGTISGNRPDSAISAETISAETISAGAMLAEIISAERMFEEKQSAPVVMIDPGHGGEDEGGAAGGVLEKEINLAIAKRVKGKLVELEYQVIMVREEDSYIAKEERAKAANESNADLYVSIHQNTSEDSSVHGVEVWYDGEDEDRDSRRLAQLIQQQIVKNTEAAGRELKGDADFHVTSQTVMPACLIETGFLTNKEERQKLVTEEYQEQIAEGIVRGIEYYFHPKTMYLTFDDGPSEENTNRVLDILKERNIKATFFLVGENVRKHPETAKRIAAEGHTIGIHCNNHDYDVLYQNTESYVADFEAAYEIIKEVTGVEARLFRFPGGSVNAYNKKVSGEIIEEMTKRGYTYFDWNASLEDAVVQSTPETLIANGVETTLGRKKVVMLAHDIIYNTGICLDELIDSLPEYEMKALTEDVEPIQF